MQHKFTCLIICVLLVSASTSRFKSESKELTKDYVYVPAKDANHKSFYISAIEITNKQYKYFINDLKARGDIDKLKRAMVDSAKWNSVSAHNEPYTNYYFQHPAYSNYPVVNISKEGAMLYCEWLTDKYNATSKAKVRFGLPNEEQWTFAAQAGDTSAIYPWQGSSLIYEKKGKWYKSDLANYKHQQAPVAGAKTNNENADITAPSVSYLPNAYGIYNMAGNVAELLADKDYTKGGSWNSTADKLAITSKEEYATGPGSRPNVGFRPIMVIGAGD